MKKGIIALTTFAAVALVPQMAWADVFVHGYYRSDGTYVRPHFRSDPDGDFSNNWSTYGNINPYTGEMGHKHFPSSSFGSSSFDDYSSSSTNDFNSEFDTSDDNYSNSFDNNSSEFDTNDDNYSSSNFLTTPSSSDTTTNSYNTDLSNDTSTDNQVTDTETDSGLLSWWDKFWSWLW